MANTIYQLRIDLLHIKPPIWRRILVSSDTDLDTFSQQLLQVMGWDGYHFMNFEADGEQYFPDEESALELGGSVMAEFTLADVLQKEKDNMLFTYDFGDNWEHTVLLEKILSPDPDTHYPRCIAGKRNCPPEDCGGPWGYAGLLETLANPKHPEHADMVEWVGGDFDPEEFDVAEVNERLK